jgi:hypothetical protein
MDNKRLAKELVKLAKDLIASPVKKFYELSPDKANLFWEGVDEEQIETERKKDSRRLSDYSLVDSYAPVVEKRGVFVESVYNFIDEDEFIKDLKRLGFKKI